MVVFAAYAAELTTKLSVFITHLPFESLRELYSETDYNIGAVVDTATEEAFSQVLFYPFIFDSKSVEQAMSSVALFFKVLFLICMCHKLGCLLNL